MNLGFSSRPLSLTNKNQVRPQLQKTLAVDSVLSVTMFMGRLQKRIYNWASKTTQLRKGLKQNKKILTFVNYKTKHINCLHAFCYTVEIIPVWRGEKKTDFQLGLWTPLCFSWQTEEDTKQNTGNLKVQEGQSRMVGECGKTEFSILHINKEKIYNHNFQLCPRTDIINLWLQETQISLKVSKLLAIVGW